MRDESMLLGIIYVMNIFNRVPLCRLPRNLSPIRKGFLTQTLAAAPELPAPASAAVADASANAVAKSHAYQRGGPPRPPARPLTGRRAPRHNNRYGNMPLSPPPRLSKQQPQHVPRRPKSSPGAFRRGRAAAGDQPAPTMVDGAESLSSMCATHQLSPFAAVACL